MSDEQRRDYDEPEQSSSERDVEGHLQGVTGDEPEQIRGGEGIRAKRNESDEGPDVEGHISDRRIKTAIHPLEDALTALRAL